MKNSKLNYNKGITLIALVITIIVLLILAGVAISMLSGENGILNKAAEAKTETENAQKEEETGLASMELETYFITNNLKYKCANGYITGIEPEDTIENLKNSLPDGYEISTKDSDVYLTTGMAITKDGKEVARTVIFGDIDCISGYTGNDLTAISKYFKLERDLEEFQKIAADVNNDGELNYEDLLLLGDVVLKKEGVVIEQNEYAKTKAKNLKKYYKKLQEYINQQNKKETEYKFEYNEENDTYKLKGVKAGTTAKMLKDALLNSDQLQIDKKANGYVEVEDNENVIDGYYLKISFIDEDENSAGEVRFAYIEVEK